MFIIIGGDGKEYGPVTPEQVRAWIIAGRANLDTKAKAAGSEEWRRLGDYPEFNGSESPPVMGAGGRRALMMDNPQVASRIARIFAALINAFFYLLCTVPGSLTLSRKLLEQNPELAQGGFPRMEDLDMPALMNGVLWVWAGLLAGILLQAILLGLCGQNLGKLMVGIRVVRVATGQRAGFIHGALLRFLIPASIIILLTLLTLVLGFIFLLVDFCFMFRGDGRCLHDLMAGTQVVKA
jgi:uncharacterized RDD family membrane protein YckC